MNLRVGFPAVVAAGACFVLSLASPAAPAATTATAEAMTVSPPWVSDPGDGPGGCTVSVTLPTQFTCHVSIRNRGTVSLSWQSWQLDSGQGNLQTTVTPNHGTIAPGAAVRVTIVTPDCGFSLADLANFLGASGTKQFGGAVLYSCG